MVRMFYEKQKYAYVRKRCSYNIFLILNDFINNLLKIVILSCQLIYKRLLICRSFFKNSTAIFGRSNISVLVQPRETVKQFVLTNHTCSSKDFLF